MAVTGTFVIETILKWAIPFICLAIVGLLTARFVNPFQKGTKQQQIEQWETLANNSSLHRQFAQQLNVIEANYQHLDQEILNKLNQIQEQNKIEREELKTRHGKIDEQLNLLREGVLENHLTNLIYTCQNFIEQGYVTPGELDRYNSGYYLYKKLGGNGHMDYWHDQVMKLPHKNEMSHEISNKKNRGDS